jgi:hypothetical protein
MQDLLSRAQNYINYEENMMGEKAEKVNAPPGKNERAREELGRRGLRRGYPEYTPLNTSRKKYYRKNPELTKANFPDITRARFMKIASN